MRHEIEAPSTGESMILDYSDWHHLLHLAARYGWRAQVDLKRYTTEEHTISAYEAKQMTDALEKANHDLDKVSEGMELAAQRLGVTAHFFPGLHKGPYEGAHWSTSRVRRQESSRGSLRWGNQWSWWSE